MNIIYTTQFGEANFPHLNKPDTQFNSQGIYQVKLLVSLLILQQQQSNLGKVLNRF